MQRPFIMPTVHETMLHEHVLSLEHRLQVLTSLVSRALPTAGIAGDLGRLPDFSSKATGPLFHVSNGQLLPQLTRAGVLSGLGPKFREAYAKAQMPEEWQKLWRKLAPVSADVFGQTMVETYFHNPWHAYAEHEWLTPEVISKSSSGLGAQNMPYFESIYKYFEEAKEPVRYDTEQQRLAFYSQPNSKTAPVLFHNGEALVLAIPVRHYNDTVIASSYLPFHGGYLLFRYDGHQRRYSRLGAAWWCEMEQCWLEDFGSTSYLTVDEIKHGVEVFENFFGLPTYEPVVAEELSNLYLSVGDWILSREAGIAQTRKLKPELAKFNHWSEKLSVGRLTVEIPNRDYYSYPVLRLKYPVADDLKYTPELTLKMFESHVDENRTSQRRTIWAGSNSLPPRRLRRELVTLLTAWLEAAAKGEFDQHEFSAWDYNDNSVNDPNLFYYEHDPARETPADTTPSTT